MEAFRSACAFELCVKSQLKMDKNKLSIVLQDYFKHSAVGSKMELAIDYCEVSAGQHHPFATTFGFFQEVNLIISRNVALVCVRELLCADMIIGSWFNNGFFRKYLLNPIAFIGVKEYLARELSIERSLLNSNATLIELRERDVYRLLRDQQRSE